MVILPHSSLVSRFSRRANESANRRRKSSVIAIGSDTSTRSCTGLQVRANPHVSHASRSLFTILSKHTARFVDPSTACPLSTEAQQSSSRELWSSFANCIESVGNRFHGISKSLLEATSLIN